MSQRRVTLLGSTGSIGTQALQVIARNPDRYAVHGLSAGGSDLGLLAQQVLQTGAEVVAVARGTEADLRAALDALPGGAATRPRVLVGPEASTELAAEPVDVVLNGITGSIGLRPTLAALESGSTLALANKESLIVGGPLVRSAMQRPDQIVPVDSEHAAIAQCLAAGRRDEVRRLVITASGGPFRGRTRAELAGVTPEQALAHPNFAMGRVITTNSATLVNKGLEVIEAHLLFDVPFDDIQVVVHPQQQIHSMVEFRDGSTIAQIGPPRMLVPIALGLSWPERLEEVDEPTDWTTPMQWDFTPLDSEAFPAVDLAVHVGRLGGTAPAVYNAANEECVEAFHEGRIGFPEIVDTVAAVVDELGAGGEESLGLDDVLAAEERARAAANARVGAGSRA
ncbi:1-deoxy-D-xylulose-5-phosphate reductoisomerase [Kytococcus sp. Marseille-QA3725]